MIALITGASSGIGEVTARRIAREPGAKLVLVARRADRLEALAASLGGDVLVLAEDLTDTGAGPRIDAAVRERFGRLDLLVNNAGAGWRGAFADVGTANLRRTLELNLFAVAQLTEALLPLLRESAPSAIVNVASTAGRVARPGSGGYSASKFALIGWSDALHLEEKANGVHVGVVNPGFVVTEGFPQTELLASPSTRWMVSTADKVADAIMDVAGGKAERYVPRGYGVAAGARIFAPRLVRRVLGSQAGAAMKTSVTADD
ncbi:FabG-like 3-oxoacyl-(acyl-carrier-protein) reductase [Baekduia alba]|uniref:SDR family NAD(P)-dependent oxidoreductase n=1 Tax=Baekduia alba TaxID=2997333 RepID=UPI002340E808|nr:SDR family NAD(P)-dependent oxidoreductase [Baekduia alba]WCB92166.1 FabG-like 3-oxoacyl-(acyl-carrier-protein) reductase [Baekduia alba]